MQELATIGPQAERLDALDSGLPFLASQAAIELDNLLLKNPVELKAVKRLAERLEKSTEQASGTQERKSLMDPATVSVFSNAIHASGIPNVITLADLASEAWQIAHALQGSADESDTHQIEKLRTFCNSLANSAVAHERSLYEKQTMSKSWS